MKGKPISGDFDALMNEEEYCESIPKANDRYMETLRERAFPTPSPFGVEWEKQRVIEAFTLIVRWSQGRKGNGADLRDFRDETLRIVLVVLPF
jgi:hypothetical protein